MAYSDFTFEELKEKFNIQFIENISLFPTTQPLPASERLVDTLQFNIPLALSIDTEKARSELIIVQVLLELKRELSTHFSFFSGTEFTVDSTKGLNGRCDYIISQSEEQFYIAAPVLMMVEAKNDRLKEGFPQCVAEMIAAQQFNQTKSRPISTIYGVVSTGSLWKFLKLEGTAAYIDQTEYHIQQVDTILGIFSYIINRSQ